MGFVGINLPVYCFLQLVIPNSGRGNQADESMGQAMGVALN